MLPAVSMFKVDPCRLILLFGYSPIRFYRISKVSRDLPLSIYHVSLASPCIARFIRERSGIMTIYPGLNLTTRHGYFFSMAINISFPAFVWHLFPSRSPPFPVLSSDVYARSMLGH